MVEYLPTWQSMQDFTARREPDTPDEIWLLEHPPVYTLGLAGKPEHLLRATDIPVVKIDRGGQITYMGGADRRLSAAGSEAAQYRRQGTGAAHGARGDRPAGGIWRQGRAARQGAGSLCPATPRSPHLGCASRTAAVTTACA